MKLKARHFEAAKDALKSGEHDFWNVLAAVTDDTFYRRGPKAEVSPQEVIKAVELKDDRRLNALTGGAEGLARDWESAQLQAMKEIEQENRAIAPERMERVVTSRATRIMAQDFRQFQDLRPEGRQIRRDRDASMQRQMRQQRAAASARAGLFHYEP